MGRASRWLVILPAIWFALTSQSAKADPQPGLNAVGYTINQIPPLRSDSAYPQCGIETENNINRNFEGEPFTGCGTDWFMLHYTGFITIPDNTSVKFMVAADDGGTVNIGGYNMGTWNIKGCSWSQQINPELPGGTYSLDGWFFEASGGTCFMLAWQVDNGDWEIVPEWAFTTASTPTTTTTTTTVPSETVPVTDPPTTTTLQETTTTVEQTTTTQEVTTTSSSSTTTTTTEPETTTSSSTSTSLPATSTTQAWAPPPQTTTTEPVVTTVPVTTTTELQEPTTTLQEVQTTTSSTSVVQTTHTTAAPTTTTSIEIPESTTSVAPTTTTPKIVIEPSGVSEQQAVAYATNPEVLATASASEASAIFEALSVSELTNTEIDALVEAVQEAPTEVRAAFEEEVDIFGEGLDEYVPLGSNIPVGTRRTLIAVTAGITLAAAGTRMRR